MRNTNSSLRSGKGSCPQGAASRFRYRRWGIAVLAVLLCGGAAEARQPADSARSSVDGERRIEEIVVTAPRKNEVIPSQTLEGRTLRQLNSYSVADAIRYFSGAQLKDYGGIGGLKTVNIRSMGSQHVGVFFDGVQIGNAQNGVVDLGRFSLDNMETVSIYNGQKSAIFQPAKDFASASAVYFETRRPVFDSLKRNNLKFTLKGGSFKTIDPSVLWEHRFGERVRGSFNAEYLYTSGEYKFRYAKVDGYDTTEVRKNGDVRFFRAEAALFGDLRDGDWRAKAYFYDSQRGYPGAVVREEPGRFRHQDRQWDTNFFLQGALRKKLAPFYALKVTGKYAYDFLHYVSDPRLDVTTMYVDNRYRQQEAYLSAANLFAITPWWSANVALDAQFNTLDADLVDFVYPQRWTVLAAAATSVRLRCVSLQGSLLYTHVTDIVRRRGEAAEDRNRLTPTLVASCRPLPGQDWQIRAFYKRIFRMPTFNDLYYTFIGNIHLEPEYTTQYDLGMTYGREWPAGGGVLALDAQADVYYNQVDNKIVAMPTSNQFRWTMLNLGYVEIKGVDVSLEGGWQRGRLSVNARLSYTYQQAQDLTDPTSPFYGDQIPYIPWNSGSAIVSVGYGGWHFNYSFIYTGERYEQAANTAENYAQPWYTSDVVIARDIALRNLSLRVALEVNNLFNQQYEVVQCYPMPGTNFKIILSLTL